MRDFEMLNDIADISILLQYLYMDENNKITFNNGIADMQIRMTDKLGVLSKNLNFPDIPEQNYSEMMFPANLVGIIDVLKEQKPEEIKNCFKNRWEEIKAVVAFHNTLHKFNTKKRFVV